MEKRILPKKIKIMEVEEIINDLSKGGNYQNHYESLMNEIGNQYSTERISSMTSTIVFDNPKMKEIVKGMHILEILYHYSKLL